MFGKDGLWIVHFAKHSSHALQITRQGLHLVHGLVFCGITGTGKHAIYCWNNSSNGSPSRFGPTDQVSARGSVTGGGSVIRHGNRTGGALVKAALIKITGSGGGWTKDSSQAVTASKGGSASNGRTS